MSNVPELNELEVALRQAAGCVQRLRDRYVREDRKVVHLEGFGDVVIGPGSHVRAAMPEESAKAKPFNASPQLDIANSASDLDTALAAFDATTRAFSSAPATADPHKTESLTPTVAAMMAAPSPLAHLNRANGDYYHQRAARLEGAYEGTRYESLPPEPTAKASVSPSEPSLTVTTRPHRRYVLQALTITEKASVIDMLGSMSRKSATVRNAFAIASVRSIDGEPVPFPKTYLELRSLELLIGRDLRTITKALETGQ